jgi:hypothetical protein
VKVESVLVLLLCMSTGANLSANAIPARRPPSLVVVPPNTRFGIVSIRFRLPPRWSAEMRRNQTWTRGGFDWDIGLRFSAAQSNESRAPHTVSLTLTFEMIDRARRHGSLVERRVRLEDGRTAIRNEQVYSDGARSDYLWIVRAAPRRYVLYVEIYGDHRDAGSVGSIMDWVERTICIARSRNTPRHTEMARPFVSIWRETVCCQ